VKIKFLDGSEKEFENLRGADLRFANLQYVNLRGADLRGANLRDAVLRDAVLSDAVLSDAILQFADLQFADLQRANLRDANLQYADLQRANLRGAFLRGAILRGAILQGTALQDAILPDFQICPETGCFRAFKKLADGRVIEIEVAADAKRTSTLVGRKCRASKARVVTEGIDGASTRDPAFRYVSGQEISVDNFKDDIRVECTAGIHFFMTRKEAEEY